MPAMADRMFHIGELAARVGLSLRTVRYYEEMGLLTPEKRTEGGFRLFTDEHVQRLLLIKQMKPLGFTVQQMRQLLEAHDALSSSDRAHRLAAEGRIAEFGRQAVERCEELRGQLARAEEFARRLAAPRPGSAG
jgi:DNA-binding transcriptional MerR regulator